MPRRLTVVAVFFAVACSGGSKSPSTPSPPPVAQVAGFWRVNSTLTSVSGGDCLDVLFQSSIGNVDQTTAQITQNGAALTAITTDTATGATCNYEGTAGANSFTLNWTRCDIGVLTGLRCPSGAIRDLRLVTSSFTGTASGNSANGTTGETWNVFIGGTLAPAGILQANGTFTATRQ
jgi:hypothetical protein